MAYVCMEVTTRFENLIGTKSLRNTSNRDVLLPNKAVLLNLASNETTIVPLPA